jgi:hypothetical protein
LAAVFPSIHVFQSILIKILRDIRGDLFGVGLFLQAGADLKDEYITP